MLIKAIMFASIVHSI